VKKPQNTKCVVCGEVFNPLEHLGKLCWEIVAYRTECPHCGVVQHLVSEDGFCQVSGREEDCQCCVRG